MEFYDFISEEELHALPLDDPERAFLAFVKIADRKCDERIRSVEDEQYNNNSVEAAQYGFMNVVYSAAANFGIKPFADEQVPLRKNFHWDAYQQFRANLSHYIAQIAFRTATAERNDSAALTDPIRKSVRDHIEELRKAIENSRLSQARKEALLKRLDALEEELGKSRIRFWVVANVVFTILSAPGAMWASYDAVMHITAGIMRDVGEAKANEDENRHPIPPEPPAALQAPRAPQLEMKGGFERDEMDDEIPF